MAYILIIEDNQTNADMMIQILQTEGHQIQHFLRGMDGAKSARKQRPDLILMDFNLPDIDGRTLAFLLKKQLGDKTAPPIVACTARIGDLEERMAAQFGCSAFLGKPFTGEVLVTTINRMLSRTPVKTDVQSPNETKT